MIIISTIFYVISTKERELLNNMEKYIYNRFVRRLSKIVISNNIK